MRAVKTSFATLALVVCMIAGLNVSAATLTVTKTADTADGACDADCSLREAITTAGQGDTIVFSALFNGAQTINIGLGQLAIDSKAITIIGRGAEILHITANYSSRIFSIQSNSDVEIRGVTLRNGFDGGPSGGGLAFGGGIILRDSRLRLVDSVMRNNTARSAEVFGRRYGYGGAIYSSNSSISLINTAIRDNPMPQWPDHASGGGIDGGGSTDIELVNSVFQRNSEGAIVGGRVVSVIDSAITDTYADTAPSNGPGVTGQDVIVKRSRIIGNNGDGVYAGGTLLIEDTLIAQNGAEGVHNNGNGVITNTTIHKNSNNGLPGLSGGGILNTGNLQLKSSAISNNTVFGSGGAIKNSGILSVVDSSITNNFASDPGGGIYNSGELYLTNSTVAGNNRGGVYNGSSAARTLITNSTIANNPFGPCGVCQQSLGTITLGNTIVSGNVGTDVGGTIISRGHNLIGNIAGGSGWVATDLTNVNPLLAPLGNNGSFRPTFALRPGSPATNSGNNSLAIDPLTQLPLTIDQRGSGRIVNNNVDIGSYEANYASGPVLVSGRVTDWNGRSIFGARLVLADGTATRYTQTNPSGYFRFYALTPGVTYTVSIDHKRIAFESPQYITADQPRDDLNLRPR